MNRRSFLNLVVGGIAVGAAVRTWPFRVYSLPSDVVIAKESALLNVINRITLDLISKNPINDVWLAPSPSFLDLAKNRGWEFTPAIQRWGLSDVKPK